MKQKTMNYKNIFGILFLILTALFLFGVLAWTLSTLQGFSNLGHEQEVERLELKKEIALINLNASQGIIKKDYECEYRLANQTIYYQEQLIGLERYYTNN